MKKKITLILAASIFSFFAKAQSFQILDGTTDVTGTTLYVSGEVQTSLAKLLSVKNTSGVSKTVKLYRIEENVMPYTENSICWDICYDVKIDTSIGSVTFNSGETKPNQFVGDYKPNDEIGTSYITYVFYDMNNTSDSSFVKIEWNSTAVGINEVDASKYQISNPYPNPSKAFVQFNYKLNDAKDNATINVYNLLGTKVKAVALNGMENKISISTNDLSDGVYFYSLTVSNKIVATKKFVVSR